MACIRRRRDRRSAERKADFGHKSNERKEVPMEGTGKAALPGIGIREMQNCPVAAQLRAPKTETCGGTVQRLAV